MQSEDMTPVTTHEITPAVSRQSGILFWLVHGNMRQRTALAITSALVLEVTGHTIDQLWRPPFVSGVITLFSVMLLIMPAILLIVSMPEKGLVRSLLILTGVCLALTVILDMTKDIRALDEWLIVGNHSAIRGNLRWSTLVGGIFLLFSTHYYAIASLMDSRTSLQAERQELLKEMQQRKLAEKNAKAAQDYAENLIQTANVIVIGLDSNRNLKVFNETAERITGFTREELQTRDWFSKLVAPERYPRAKEELLNLVKDGVPRHIQWPIVTKSGEVRQITWSNSEVFEGDQVTGTISFGLDMTDRKREEAELLRSSKLATLGVVAAGLAHEIGNPLASLSARLRLMQENNDPEFWAQSIAVLQRQITRISQIVHGVSRFSRPLRMEQTACSVNNLVADALEVVRFHEGAKRCKIGMDLAIVSPMVIATPDQLIQVFLNLGLNALEAMPNGGTLTVATRSSGPTAEIVFSDTGTGLTEDALKKMFDAFYTSKADGMGLGLNIAKTIIAGHNGKIAFENNVTGGACFRVLLPGIDLSPQETNNPGGGLA